MANVEEQRLIEMRGNLLPHIEKHFPWENAWSLAIREHIADVCVTFIGCGLADPKFVSELSSGSDQKFWACVSEAMVANLLRDKCFGVRKAGAGPDFLVMNGSQKIWIEVICPEAVGVPPNWLTPTLNEVVHFPHKEILLRWTSAIKQKAEALIGNSDGTRAGYVSTGVVSPDDSYVIAVNGCRLRSNGFPSLFGISQFPFAAEAVFPIGPYQVRIDKETLEMLAHGHKERPYVFNKNGAAVPALTFLDPKFDLVSAIWAMDLNGTSIIGNREPKVVIHNPNAKQPIPLGFLPSDGEYVAVPEGNSLTISKVTS